MRSLLLASVVSFSFPSLSSAAFIYDFEQVGQDVVVTGSGTLNVSGLGAKATGQVERGLNPGLPYIALGGSINQNNPYLVPYADLYSLNTPTTGFGQSISNYPTAFSGDFVGNPFSENLIVPVNYVSGSALSNISTFARASFASLGLSRGTYTSGFGSGSTFDTFTIQVGPAPIGVPEPASLALLGMGVLGLAAVGRFRAA